MFKNLFLALELRDFPSPPRYKTQNVWITTASSEQRKLTGTLDIEATTSPSLDHFQSKQSQKQNSRSQMWRKWNGEQRTKEEENVSERRRLSWCSWQGFYRNLVCNFKHFSTWNFWRVLLSLDINVTCPRRFQRISSFAQLATQFLLFVSSWCDGGCYSLVLKQSMCLHFPPNLAPDRTLYSTFSA